LHHYLNIDVLQIGKLIYAEILGCKIAAHLKLCSVGSIVTFEETIDFGVKRRGFNFDFLAPIITDGRMYRCRIDIVMFILSVGTISASHNGQLRRRGSA